MTMYRYMALMWSGADREAAAAAKFLAAKLPEVSPHKWSQAWDGAGLAIYHAGEHKGRMQTYRLQGERGAVLGRLFRNDYTSLVDDLDEFESRKCVETRGQRLIDDYWGRYVAFLNDPETGTRYVMRDPTGAFPCFHTPFKGTTIYFSDMQDAANFDFLPFTVNWEYLKANIVLPNFQKTITGLNEVGEVLPAECVEVAPFERKSRFVWNPTEISQTDVVEDPEEAAALLRETVKNTIGALAGCYDRIMHKLGGLDSSIALACMMNAPKRPAITCVNYFTKSPRGEERFYSRQMADKAGVRLIEMELDHSRADLNKIFSSNKLARPLAYFDCINLTGDMLALAKRDNAEAFFTGVGGDNVFFRPTLNIGALDYFQRHGIGNMILKVWVEASRYGRTTLRKSMHDMLRECFFSTPCYQYIWNRVFEENRSQVVNPEFLNGCDQESYLHPLLVPADRMLKGKYFHILCCALFSIEHYDHWDQSYHAERVHAYLTQPIIEACLRIPAWILTYGGIDRGLARKAFRNDLPSDIVKRQSKSTPAEYYRDLYEHNLSFLRDTLLNGQLVRKGVLHHARLERALRIENLHLHVWHSQFLGYAGTEAWLRGWMARPIAKPQLARAIMVSAQSSTS